MNLKLRHNMESETKTTTIFTILRSLHHTNSIDLFIIKKLIWTSQLSVCAISISKKNFKMNFVCDLCKDQFKFKYELVVHMEDHLNHRNRKNRKLATVEGLWCDQAHFIFKKIPKNNFRPFLILQIVILCFV